MMPQDADNTLEKETALQCQEDSQLVEVDTTQLKDESKELINKIVKEKDVEKTKDLAYLFNVNQNKKTLVRINKMNDLLDALTDQALNRLTNKPDEISNKELLDGMKTVQDMIERGQRQTSGSSEDVFAAPLIQINQQNNEVNLSGEQSSLSRESREKVKNAVLNLLKGVTTEQNNVLSEEDNDNIIIAESVELKDNDDED